MAPWRPATGRRRTALFALALLAHALGIGAMLAARVRVELPGDVAVSMAIWTAPPPAAAAPRPLPPPPSLPRLLLPRPVPVPVPVPVPPSVPLLPLPLPAFRMPPPEGPAARATAEPAAIALAASAPEPVASAASAPLRLTLSRAELRALIANTKPTLAQSLARGPAPSPLARLGGEEAAYEEVPQAGGVTEVHVHGGCFRLVPTPRSQYDPFNHAGERLMAACH